MRTLRERGAHGVATFDLGIGRWGHVCVRTRARACPGAQAGGHCRAVTRAAVAIGAWLLRARRMVYLVPGQVTQAR